MEYYGGSLCEVWQNVTTVGHKKNTYTLWVAKPERDGRKGTAVPLHYEMMGYNTLLGSHYDKYLVDYKDFSTHLDPKVFSLPEGFYSIWKMETRPARCKVSLSPVCCDRDELWRLSGSRSGAPHAGQSNERDHPHVRLRTLAEDVWPLQGEVPASVRRRKGARGEGARLSAQPAVRAPFLSSLLPSKGPDSLSGLCCSFIHSKNRARLPFTLAVNSLADRTMSELQSMRGGKRGKTPNGGLPFPSSLYRGVKVPETLDWRLYGMYEGWSKLQRLFVYLSMYSPFLLRINPEFQQLGGKNTWNNTSNDWSSSWEILKPFLGGIWGQ